MSDTSLCQYKPNYPTELLNIIDPKDHNCCQFKTRTTYEHSDGKQYCILHHPNKDHPDIKNQEQFKSLLSYEIETQTKEKTINISGVKLDYFLSFEENARYVKFSEISVSIVFHDVNLMGGFATKGAASLENIFISNSSFDKEFIIIYFVINNFYCSHSTFNGEFSLGENDKHKKQTKKDLIFVDTNFFGDVILRGGVEGDFKFINSICNGTTTLNLEARNSTLFKSSNFKELVLMDANKFIKELTIEDVTINKPFKAKFNTKKINISNLTMPSFEEGDTTIDKAGLSLSFVDMDFLKINNCTFHNPVIVNFGKSNSEQVFNLEECTFENKFKINSQAQTNFKYAFSSFQIGICHKQEGNYLSKKKIHPPDCIFKKGFEIDGVTASRFQIYNTVTMGRALLKNIHIAYSFDVFNSEFQQNFAFEWHEEGENFQPALAMDFKNTIFKIGPTFSNIKFGHRTEFSECTFEKAPTFIETEFSKHAFFPNNTFLSNEPYHISTFQYLKKEMQEQHNFQDMAQFFRLEQRCRREQSKNKAERFFSTAYDFISRYGTSVSRPLFLLSVVIALFFFTHLFWIYSLPGTPEYKQYLTSSNVIDESIRATIEPLTRPFSVWSIRYNIPLWAKNSPTWFRAAASIHSLLSLSFLALFFLAIRRRFKLQ